MRKSTKRSSDLPSPVRKPSKNRGEGGRGEGATDAGGTVEPKIGTGGAQGGYHGGSGGGGAKPRPRT